MCVEWTSGQFRLQEEARIKENCCHRLEGWFGSQEERTLKRSRVILEHNSHSLLGIRHGTLKFGAVKNTICLSCYLVTTRRQTLVQHCAFHATNWYPQSRPRCRQSRCNSGSVGLKHLISMQVHHLFLFPAR